jgi:hypothetical protein
MVDSQQILQHTILSLSLPALPLGERLCALTSSSSSSSSSRAGLLLQHAAVCKRVALRCSPCRGSCMQALCLLLLLLLLL